MLEGVVPFPPEFAARYRAKGYWQDKPLVQEFAPVFAQFADRVALIDGARQYTYRDIDRISDNLALNLLELGLKPLDRVVPTLPNVAEFVLLYFALQKIGCIPIAALVTHRYNEVSQFVAIARAVACVYPERQSDFEFAPMIRRIAQESPFMRFAIVLGTPGPGELSLTELIERPARLPKSALGRDQDRSDRPLHLPALGRHHRGPQAHPAHAQRLCLQLQNRSAGVRRPRRFGAAAGAADRAQPAAWPARASRASCSTAARSC